jgi:hypothetical protein
MLKKHVLAAAVLALTSGIAFAENEAIIEQIGDDGSLNAAIIEQVRDNTNVSYGQIIQETTLGDGALTTLIYQGVASGAGTLLPSAPAALNGTEIDLSVDAWVDNAPAPYEAKSATVANFAYIKQDTVELSQAVIVQMSVDEAADFDPLLTLFANDLVVDTLVGTAGVATGAVTDGVNDLTALGLLDNVADSTANANNIAAVSQGSEVIDRNGDTLGGLANAGGAGDIALILQMGSDNIAQVLQTGDGPQTAAVIQADSGNDAYVAQYAGESNTATIVQVGIGDRATVYQAGATNIATVYQRGIIQ